MHKGDCFLKIVLLSIVLSVTKISYGQIPYNYARWDSDGLFLNNGTVMRYISFRGGKISTTSLRIPDSKFNFVNAEIAEPEWVLESDEQFQKGQLRKEQNPLEFSFLKNGISINGNSGWKIIGIENIARGQGKGAVLKLVREDIGLSITYLLYPNLPVIRKRLEFINLGENEIRIENLDIESLNLPWGNTHNMVYRNYARNKHIGPFIGEWDDPLVAMQSKNQNRGILIGNEAPDVLKRISACLDEKSLKAGLTYSDQDYPFRIWLEPGETWKSPWTFIIPYTGVTPSEAISGTLASYVREHMGIRLTELQNKPTFVYNTWNPFRKEINEKLILELAKAASECGIEEFVIDDGWQTNRGDWEIDYNKFPNGLKPVFDSIKTMGMKPGLWLALATVEEGSRILQEHPEWCVKYSDGSPTSVHAKVKNKYTVCMTSGWKDYIRDVILNLVHEHGLEYLKLDLAIVTGAYMFDRSRSGCYSKEHTHKDREESFLEIYNSTWQLFDELHAKAPELFIDCTFETMGALQTIDYDMCKHAEGNWLSNFEQQVPWGSQRVRQMAWWRSNVIPATALVIGNQTMDDPQWELSMKSLIGTLPIMLRDPRKVPTDDKQKMRKWADWMQEKQKSFNIMMYRQDLLGFGEPQEGNWDGWCRINTKSKQGGFENKRTVRISGLHPDQIYNIHHAPKNKLVAQLSGLELKEKGFEVFIADKYGGEVYSVEQR
ncbi:alpha-galactosidase [uncultured Draconibacterium sp.]|uniref:glycoside hydrolase family 36 protein n=1 Tax=uncultured Draconibacterium sp. TaxID=1573823 RepID=UPI0029C803E2|nr:alpha-galactosidase [uncultured Draconibacterium sp.]